MDWAYLIDSKITLNLNHFFAGNLNWFENSKKILQHKGMLALWICNSSHNQSGILTGNLIAKNMNKLKTQFVSNSYEGIVDERITYILIQLLAIQSNNSSR